MESNFDKLWDGSRLFRTLFLHNKIFRSVNDIDLGKAEAFWWDRFPRVHWDFCAKPGCHALAPDHGYCHKHSPDKKMPEWKWSLGVLYHYRGTMHRDKENAKVQYVAYHLDQGRRVFGDIPVGYKVHWRDGNPFNLRRENLILLSKVICTAVDAGVISIATAMDLDDLLVDAFCERYGRARPRRQWTYTTETIAKAAKMKPESVRRAISEGELDPDDLRSVALFCRSRNVLTEIVIPELKVVPVLREAG